MGDQLASDSELASPTADRIEQLVRRLAEAEAELRALTGGQADAVIDPIRGTPLLLSDAQQALRQAHAELEERVRERTADLSRANDALRAEIAQRERAQAALELYAWRLEITAQMDRAILAAHTQNEIASIAESQLRRLLECQRASVIVFDEQAGKMQVIAAQPEGGSRIENGWQGPLPAPIVLDRLRDGQPYVVDDTSALPGRHPLVGLLLGDGVGAAVLAPLMVGGQLFGSLGVGRATPGPWLDRHVEIVRDVAVQLAIGIEQARLRSALRHHADELEHEVTRRTAELQASEARNRTIFEAAGVGIAIVDRHGFLRESNAMLQEMLGYSGQELQGMSYARFMLPADVRDQEASFRQFILGELDEQPFCREIRYLPRNGQLRWGQAAVSLVREAEGKPSFGIVMLHDITEQKETMEALVEAEKLAVTGRLTALLAHEINNPLQSVVGCLGLAEKSLAQSKDPSAYVGVARQEVRRVSDIVAQLRDMNRSSSEEEHKRVSINKLVANALGRVTAQCKSRNIQVSWQPTRDLPLIPLAADRMEQVFTSLALNAVEAMPTGGRLQARTLSTDQPAGVQVSISDTGTGPGSDVIAQLAEPFVADKPLGRGLGLYIGNRIVEEHGGRIEVDSQPGKGTTFRVWLPLQPTL
jgi:PAS domain S-box-containing protein